MGPPEAPAERALHALAEVMRALGPVGTGAPDRAGDVVARVLARTVGADVVLLLEHDVAHGDTTVSGPAATPETEAVARHHLRRHGQDDPLAAILTAGSLQPRSARRELGAAWEGSPAHDYAVRRFGGVDELATLPLHGSAEGFAVYLLGRRGREFDDDDLALLAALQPCLAQLDALLRGRVGTDPAADAPAAPLTGREVEVLGLLARGHKAATIARAVSCSPRTVHRHLSNIYAKLGVADRLSAVNRARELGLVGVSS